MDKNKFIKQNLLPEEKLMFSKAFDQAFVCENRNIPTFTDFLDPLSLRKITAAFKDNISCKMMDFGGAEGCERSVLGFFPDYTAPDTKAFPIVSIEIITETNKLTHRDYLGSILGTGVNRALVGDIFVFEKKAIAFLSEKISNHVCGSLIKIGKNDAHVSVIEDDYLIAPFADAFEFEITVASLRLDNIISKAFNISRSMAAKLIEGEKALINWICAKNISASVKEEDIITLRGYGRVSVKSINGQTKKGNISLTVMKTG